MGQDYSDMELFSFHSTSKGLEGEYDMRFCFYVVIFLFSGLICRCGKRGGYVEFQGIDPSARELFYKMQSVNLCPNVLGQMYALNFLAGLVLVLVLELGLDSENWSLSSFSFGFSLQLKYFSFFSALGCIVDPPKPGQPSHANWFEEREAIFASLQRRAKTVQDTLNQLEGVSCQTVEGALYAFPTITIPKSAVEAAKALGIPFIFLFSRLINFLCFIFL
jgi:alanine transaminase